MTFVYHNYTQSQVSPFIKFGPNARLWFGKIKEKLPEISNTSEWMHVNTVDKRYYKPIQGQQGGFTIKDTPAQQDMAYFTGTYLSSSEFGALDACHREYAFRIEPNGHPRFFVIPSYNGVAEYINDGYSGKYKNGKPKPSKNNAKFEVRYHKGLPYVVVVSTKFIRAHQQVRASYGSAYWQK